MNKRVHKKICKRLNLVSNSWFKPNLNKWRGMLKRKPTGIYGFHSEMTIREDIRE